MPAPVLSIAILGAGDAFATGGHPYSSYLLERRDPAEGEFRSVLIDCGPTAVPMFKSMGYDLERIVLALITHLHGDHIAGIPFLYLDYQFASRRGRPLTVAGPPGIEEKCEGLFGLCYAETAKMMKRRFEVDYRVLPEGEGVEMGGLRILARKMVHQHNETPYGYRVEWAGRAVGFSGDTEWCEGLVELARDTDLFLMECYTAGKKVRFHTSLEDIEREAPRLASRRLLLTHMGESTLLRLAEGSLPFEAAHDGQRIDI